MTDTSLSTKVLAELDALSATARQDHTAPSSIDTTDDTTASVDSVIEVVHEDNEEILPVQSQPVAELSTEVDPFVPSADGKTYTKREYQLSARTNVLAAITAWDRRILLVSPTGTGKNHMTAMILGSPELRDHFGVADGEDLRVMYFAHKQALLVQGLKEIGAVDGVHLIPQSIFSKIPQETLDQGWHFSIHDEAHHEPMLSFQEKLGYITDAQMLGLTATPERADKFSLKFDAVINAISREDAARLGYLAPATVHSVVDMGTLDKPDLLGELIDEYGRRMERTIVYLKTKTEAYAVNKMLREKGYQSEALVDVTNTRFEAVKKMFEGGELDFVVNCQKLDEGVDFKGVKGVIIARGVLSPPLLNQIIGRAARIDEPECHIWQFIDPLKDNLDACAIVGKQVDHFLYYIRAGVWNCDQMSVAIMDDEAGNSLEVEDVTDDIEEEQALAGDAL